MSRRLSGDRGSSLPELMVAMIVSSVVLIGVATVTGQTLRTSSQASTRVTSTSELRQAMDVMVRRLRVAVRPDVDVSAFVVAKPTEVQFFASITPPGATTTAKPTLVKYALATAGCPGLRETRTTPVVQADGTLSWSVAGTVVRSSCLSAGTVTGGSGGALFTYYDTAAANAPLATGVARPAAVLLPATADATSGVATTLLDNISSVQLDVRLSAGTGTPRPVAATTSVTLTNLLPTT